MMLKGKFGRLGYNFQKFLKFLTFQNSVSVNQNLNFKEHHSEIFINRLVVIFVRKD